MQLCDYGCEQQAKFQLKNGKWCCQDYYGKCPDQRKKNSLRQLGKPGWNKGIPHTENVRKKMSKKLKGRLVWNKGKTGIYSENTLKKMSEAKKGKSFFTGKKHSEETKEKLRKLATGRVLSEETKKKISKRQQGKSIHTEESRRKIGLGNKGKIYNSETKKKMRLSAIKRINRNIKDGGQMVPQYNPAACKLINEYAKKHNLNFQHAENGGEFHIKELGYWVDGYDENKNIIIEVDESAHFKSDGTLTDRDIQRQKEITEHLNCKFIRL